MDFSISQFEFRQRPPVTIPTPEFLKVLTEEGVRKMVSDHYDLLVKSKISHLFPRNEEALNKAKQNSADFFIQICGGPTYYQENRGKPMLAQRHAAGSITPEARVVWLQCYIQVLSKLELPDEIAQSFWNYLNVFSFWMVNSKEDYKMLFVKK
jgi:hemoglobin